MPLLSRKEIAEYPLDHSTIGKHFHIMIVALMVGAGWEGNPIAKYIALGGPAMVGFGSVVMTYGYIASKLRNGGHQERERQPAR